MFFPQLFMWFNELDRAATVKHKHHVEVFVDDWCRVNVFEFLQHRVVSKILRMILVVKDNIFRW